ncbi:hypothetical protein BDF21DRAFT_333982 [Thamnidium elegans]|nr:hypothetical protein BDF21DRAFT_333982 [Thamnidium elegans]
MYDNCSNIIEFKVNIRLIYIFEEEIFDLNCCDTCMSNAPSVKLNMSKLLREGKLI